jgi:hypothetical protein
MKSLVLAASIMVPIALFASSSLTIYSDGFGLITENREMEFKKGTQEVLFEGVTQYIEPSSVLFSCDGVGMLEQNFEYDLVDSGTLLKRYLGKEIEVFLKEGEVISGVLLASDRDVILDSGNGIVVTQKSAIEQLRYPELPDGLRLRPALRWELSSSVRGKRDVGISYISRGLNWHAEYVCLLNENDDSMNMASWVQLSNTSGIGWQDAKLQLVAGEVNRVQQNMRNKGRTPVAMEFADAGSGFAEESFFEYHLYSLDRSINIANNQDKQVALFDPKDVRLEKEYIFNSNNTRDGVQVFLNFKNSKNVGPGLPLPAGKVRMYKRDSKGNRQLIGEDLIKHTPVDEKISLKAGKAFDVVAERVVTVNEGRGNHREVEVRFDLRNRKKEAIELMVKEQSWGDVKVLHSDLEWTKKEAGVIQIPVKLKAGQEKSFTIRYRTK